MTDDPKPPRTMTYKKVEYNVFTNTVNELGKSEAEVCKALGYSDTTWFKWRDEQKMPQVAAVACEALRRRRNGKDGTTFLVKTTTAPQSQALKALCKGLGCEFVNI